MPVKGIVSCSGKYESGKGTEIDAGKGNTERGKGHKLMPAKEIWSGKREIN